MTKVIQNVAVVTLASTASFALFGCRSDVDNATDELVEICKETEQKYEGAVVQIQKTDTKDPLAVRYSLAECSKVTEEYHKKIGSFTTKWKDLKGKAGEAILACYETVSAGQCAGVEALSKPPDDELADVYTYCEAMGATSSGGSGKQTVTIRSMKQALADCNAAVGGQLTASGLEIGRHHHDHLELRKGKQGELRHSHRDAFAHTSSDFEIWGGLTHGHYEPQSGSSGLEISDHHEADHHQVEPIPHYSSDLEIWSSLAHPPHQQSDLEIWEGLSVMEQDHRDDDKGSYKHTHRTLAPAHDHGRDKADHSRARVDDVDNDILSE